MARRVITTLVDDIDGGEAADTLMFGLDGTTYEIDLTDEHLEHVRSTLAPYVGAARRTGGRSKRGGRFARPVPAPVAPQRADGDVIVLPPDAKTVRAWCSSHGIDAGVRGRVPQAAIDAYMAAHE